MTGIESVFPSYLKKPKSIINKKELNQSVESEIAGKIKLQDKNTKTAIITILYILILVKENMSIMRKERIDIKKQNASSREYNLRNEKKKWD